MWVPEAASTFWVPAAVWFRDPSFLMGPGVSPEEHVLQSLRFMQFSSPWAQVDPHSPALVLWGRLTPVPTSPSLERGVSQLEL